MEDLERLDVLEPEEVLVSVEEPVVLRDRDGVTEGLYMFPAPPRPAGV